MYPSQVSTPFSHMCLEHASPFLHSRHFKFSTVVFNNSRHSSPQYSMTEQRKPEHSMMWHQVSTFWHSTQIMSMLLVMVTLSRSFPWVKFESFYTEMANISWNRAIQKSDSNLKKGKLLLTPSIAVLRVHKKPSTMITPQTMKP